MTEEEKRIDPDYLTGEIVDGLGEEYFVEFYNKLVGQIKMNKFLRKPAEPKLTQQLAKLVKLYPDAKRISEEMRIERVKFREEQHNNK